jgi:phosphoglycolate phosphatase
MSRSSISPPISLACLDMAGTTVSDGGLVEAAFAQALEAAGVEPGSDDHQRMLAYVSETMGTSKIVVFRALFPDPDTAEKVNVAFEEAYSRCMSDGALSPIPGAEEAIEALRRSGVNVALHTGFSSATRDQLLAALGWQDMADLFLCPQEAGRGRPYPDMILASILRLGIDDVAAVAVAGDTTSDVLSGLRAGSPVVAGVLTGAHDADLLRGAGATHTLAAVAELPEIIGLD